MHRKQKPLLALALLLAFLPGCRPRHSDGDRALRIGVAVYKGDDTYITNMTAALQAAVNGYVQDSGRQVNLAIADAQESQTTQNGQIDRFLDLGYDALCVNLVDRTDAARIVDKARSANVPVVFFNREPVLEDLKTWNKAYYVGSNARSSARMQAQIVAELWEKDPAALDTNGDGVLQYVMLEGESRHQDAVIRTEVSVQTLKDRGIPVERIDGGIANWDRNQAAALTEMAFAAHAGEIELILCNNDDMALGAADAVARLGLDFHNIVGIDGTPQGTEAVDDGRILGTVDMDSAGHGRTIFQLSLALAGGEEIPDTVKVGDDHSVRVPMYIYGASG